MPEIAQYSPGTFCWVDAGINDVEKAKAFYATVFGWGYATADDSGYTMCLKAGKPVAGLYPLSEDLLQMGAAPCWMPYAAVADADAAVAAAQKAGGEVVVPVMEVGGVGRMAVLRSADAAHFSILEPAPMP